MCQASNCLVSFTSVAPGSFASNIGVFGGNVSLCFPGAQHCTQSTSLEILKCVVNRNNNILQIRRTMFAYQSLDEEAIADVILLNEGRHPPGKIYSLIKSELCLYSLYRSSGIDMNYEKINHSYPLAKCSMLNPMSI